MTGDSLINRPWQSFNLSSRLTSLTEAPEGTTVNYFNLGNNGEEIATTLARTPSVLAQYQPWAVLHFWDSDCSNVDESKLTPAQVTAVRANYSANLLATARLILRSGARLAIGTLASRRSTQTSLRSLRLLCPAMTDALPIGLRHNFAPE